MANCVEGFGYIQIHCVKLMVSSEGIGQESRHKVVCRAAQKAVVSHREYIDRKTKNVIFTPM